MRNAIRTLVAATLLSGLTASADATVCERWPARGLFEGPVGIGYYDADVATGRRVCPRTEVSLGVRGGAVMDVPDFYGSIGAAGVISGSYALSSERELFATLEAVRYDWVVNAVLEASSLSLGQLTVGGTQSTFQGTNLAGSISARLMLPTSVGSNARVVGAELGHGLTFRPGDALEVHGYAGLDLAGGLSAAPTQVRAGGLVNAGIQYSPTSWFGVVLDVNGRVGGLSNYLAPALALRFRVWNELGAELAATAPVIGTERHLAMGGLRIGYRL